MSVRAAVVVAVTVGLLGLAAPARAASAPGQRLRRAADGAWAGQFGTLVFRRDGTATFTVKACGYTPVRPGFVQTFTDCAADVVTGRLRITPTRYVIRESDGAEPNFGAYVDRGVLHVGPGSSVGRLDDRREGSIDLGGGSVLYIGDGACRFTAPGSDDLEAPCSFRHRSGRTVLVYTWPDPYRGGKTTRAGLVYLAQQHLVITPELLDYTFSRADA